MASLLSNGLVQTALVLASPILVPRTIALVQRFLNPRPAGTRTPAHPAFVKPKPSPDSPTLASLRLFVVALGVSIALFTALLPPHNLFLSLAVPDSLLSRLFPLLRPPLDIRLATETLHRAWSHQLARPLTDSELALVQRLQTLDARLAYIAYGAGPLMGCSWCRGPGSDGPLVGADYLLAVAPGTAIAYLTLLAGMGLLLAGNGRERWRKWAVVVVVLGMAAEMWTRLTWEGTRGSAEGAVTMLNSRLHLQRALAFSFLLLFSYLAPPSPSSFGPHASAAAVIAPAISSITAQAENLLSRLRVLSIERMSVLHKDEYREKVNSFWSHASSESALARSNPAVQTLLAQTRETSVEPFKAWLEGAMSLERRGEGQAEGEGEGEGTEDEDEDESDGEEERGEKDAVDVKGQEAEKR
ncbi:hypothetical protein JCM1840_000383 [Sporobolomyces johnsonii]